jgi:hypothetical protein
MAAAQSAARDRCQLLQVPPCHKPFVSAPPPPSTCCLVARCSRLRVIVVCSTPWTPVPGAPLAGDCASRSSPDVVNQPPAICALPLTPGTPWPITIGGRPFAYPVFDPVPAEVQAALAPTPASAMRSLVFDFPGTGNVGEGVLLASGAGGCVQASMKFRYRWCGPQTCGDVVLPQFEVLGCSSQNARISILDDTTYLSSDVCTESIVVVQVVQFCPALEAGAPGSGATTGDVPCRTGPLRSLDARKVSGGPTRLPADLRRRAAAARCEPRGNVFWSETSTEDAVACVRRCPRCPPAEPIGPCPPEDTTGTLGLPPQ